MFKKIALDNNIPLLLESMHEVHSVCIGIWVKIGSRDEKPGRSGISHFLEHMLFKGTARRTAQDIAKETDSIGGELNAFTSTEYTLFYIKVLDEYLEQGIDLLTDIFLNSTIPDSDIEKEKNIIIEELKMVEDNPADYIHELFNRNIWGEEGLGQSVLGKRETINLYTRENLLDHIKEHYGTENIIVACSGNFNEEKLVGYIDRTVGSLKRNSILKKPGHQKFTGEVNIVAKDLSEAHICIGLQGLHYGSDDRYVMHLLNTILGSGFSSRLFQNVREERGLVYAIYSYHSAYFDTGLWAVYAGTDRKHVSEVINITIDEMRNLSATVTADELQRAKSQLKGNLVLALESTSNKMTNMSKQEIYYGKYFSPEEIITIVESVTLGQVKELSQKLVGDNAFALTVYGPVNESELKKSCTLLQ